MESSRISGKETTRDAPPGMSPAVERGVQGSIAEAHIGSTSIRDRLDARPQQRAEAALRDRPRSYAPRFVEQVQNRRFGIEPGRPGRARTGEHHA
ncbi:hypothetical protein [Paraburkholderia caballeronis]|uniref:hypothetical protein n=1 Tax=Paraburkholderia caballeronis TaxID=416943 RepID=UPI0010665855|nr:hypothetical protein [Paraburkholderia caballeronis]